MTRSDSTSVPDYLARLRLDGKGIVVIGAGQGIGRQATHALAQAGASTLCVDLDEGLATDVASEVGGIAWTGDATRRDEAERLFGDARTALGSVDGVVDIVGMARYAPLADVGDDDWNWHFDIVLRHAFLAMQLGAAAMRETGGGAMAFVASVSGITAAPMHAAYGAAKAGLMALVKSAAVEFGKDGIRINAVAPGVVMTPRVSAYLDDDAKARNAANAPLRRVAHPDDIAGALLFLMSDLAGYVTGQTLVVDGGVGAKFPYPLPGQ